MIKVPDVQMTVNYFDLLCNSPYFVFAAQGWSELVEAKKISEKGGYSLDSKCPVIVANDHMSNDPLGLVTYSEYVNTQNDTYIWVDFVYVKPDAREIGVFKALMDEIKELAKDKDAKYIELGTHRSNHEMLAASKRIGFETNSISLRKYI